MAVTTVTAACGFSSTQLVFNDAYIWLVNIVGISGIIMWLGIAVSHIRFVAPTYSRVTALRPAVSFAVFPCGPDHRLRHVSGRHGRTEL